MTNLNRLPLTLLILWAVSIAPSGAQSPSVYDNGILNRYETAKQNQVQNDLELRKVQLEERRLYLSAISGSPITEEKACEISKWVLTNLKDYPHDKRAAHLDEDTQLLAEAILSVRK